MYVTVTVRNYLPYEGTADVVPYGSGDLQPSGGGDGDVDLADFAVFQICFGELGVGDCAAGNMTGSGSIDLSDLEEFVDALTGP